MAEKAELFRAGSKLTSGQHSVVARFLPSRESAHARPRGWRL